MTCCGVVKKNSLKNQSVSIQFCSKFVTIILKCHISSLKIQTHGKFLKMSFLYTPKFDETKRNKKKLCIY